MALVILFWLCITTTGIRTEFHALTKEIINPARKTSFNVLTNILKNMHNSLAPSILAALIMSLGKECEFCLIKNIKKGKDIDEIVIAKYVSSNFVHF